MEKMQKFAMKNRLLAAVIFGPFLLVVIVVWIIAAQIELFKMYIRGYEWDRYNGGYVNLKTGERIKGWS
jgi:hypothetical protein